MIFSVLRFPAASLDTLLPARPFMQSFVLVRLPSLSPITKDVPLTGHWKNLFFLPDSAFIIPATFSLPLNLVLSACSCLVISVLIVIFLLPIEVPGRC